MAGRLCVGDWAGLPAWAEGVTASLPEGAARHVQVWRLQPGDAVEVFDGRGQCWMAEVASMGRREVTVTLRTPREVLSEMPVAVTLAVGMPANDRMDFLVEKAAELGVAHIQPLMCARSVLKLDGDRALKKVAHWQGVAAAACEQSGRARVPTVAPVQTLSQYLQACARADNSGVQRAVLSPRADDSLGRWAQAATGPDAQSWVFLSGPEGGLSADEEAAALAQGWHGVRLGPRVLRADTAPLAALAVLGSLHEG